MDASKPYASREAFLTHGLDEVLLGTTLDCSICREPLAVALGKSENAPLHLPCRPIVSLPHVAIDDETSGSCMDQISPQNPDSTRATSTDDNLVPESAVRILPCRHIFGRICLTMWFSSSKSNRCPECNQELFPNHHLRLFLREPTRSMRIEFAKYIEEIYGDHDTAEVIRDSLMSDWTRSLIREVAMELWRQQGYEVEYQYVGGGRAEQEEDEYFTHGGDNEVNDSETEESKDDDNEELDEEGGAMRED